jgi:chaperonin cofactor prefoldin
MYGKIRTANFFNFKSIKNLQSQFSNIKTKISSLKDRINKKLNLGTYSSYINKKTFDFLKILPFSIISGIILLEKEKRLYCFKASNKELDKMMNNLENQIKNLEFRYHGKLRRQPIK